MLYLGRSRGARRSRRLRLRAIVLISLSLALGACRTTAPEVSTQEAVRRGDEAIKKNEYVQAINAYRIAVQNEPRNGELRLKLASAHRGAAQWGNAVREAIAASDLLPGNREAQLLAIEGMTGTQRVVDALDRLQPLMKQSPDDPRLLVLYGNARAQLRTSTYALFELSEAWRGGRGFEAARLHLRPPPSQSDDRAAEAALRRAVELDPKSYDARMSLAGFLWATNRLDEGAALLKTAADEAPGHAFLNRTMGLYHEHQKRDDEAERYLKTAAATKQRESALALADFYVRKNRLAEALAILEPLAAAADDDGTANLRAAEVEIMVGKHRQAIQRADKELAARRNGARALLIKARALLDAGERTKALEVAREAVSAAPASGEARLVLGEALVAAGDLNHAFDEYSEAWRSNTRDPAIAKTLAGVALALGRDSIAEDLANQSLRLRPGDVETALIFVRAQVRLGNYAAAEKALIAAKGETDTPGILALQGSIHAGRGNDAAARSAFLKALQLDRDSLEALSGLVALEIKARHAERARPQVEQSVARHARDPGYLLLTARIAAAESDTPRAEKALRTILEIDHAREDALLQLATLLAPLGRQKEAQTAIERALEKRPSSQLRLALADLLEQQSQPDAARAQYERVIADSQLAGASTDRVKTLHVASAGLAALYANQGSNLDRALELASTAKRTFPNDPTFSDILGWVHVRKDRARIGLPHIEAAVRAQPDNPVFRYHLGAAFEQLAEFEKARAELTRALALSPTFRGANEARALLKAIGK